MRPARVLCPLAGLLAAAVAVSPLLAQIGGTGTAGSPKSGPTSGVSTGTPGGISTSPSRLPSRTLRQILPDPALLDGSKLAPDKYPEYGMIGDFEMPGDDVTDPAQNQRVGASNPNQTEPTPGGNAKMDPTQKASGGSSAQSKAGQAGGGGAESQSAAQGGGGQSQSDKSGSANGGSNSSGGGSNTANTKAGGRSPGRNDPNAKAEGVQVGQLNIDEGLANTPQIDTAGAPVDIGIGDTANAIKPVANPNTTGTQNAGNTQQSSKAAGPGGSTSGAGGSSGNRGAERGKTMPSGL